MMQTERYAGSDRPVVEDWLNRALVAVAARAGAIASAGILVGGSLAPIQGVRDALWTLGFSGLTGQRCSCCGPSPRRCMHRQFASSSQSRIGGPAPLFCRNAW